MFSLTPDIDHVGDDEWGCNVKNADPDSPEGVGDALGDHSGEGSLLEGRDVVSGRAPDRGQLAEAVCKTSNRQLHPDLFVSRTTKNRENQNLHFKPKTG